MRPNRIAWLTLFAAVAIALGADCLAQEVGFIDLTKVTAHRDLRRPPSSKSMRGPHGGIQETHSCFDSTKNAGTLRTALVSLDRPHYQIGDQPVFEVTVENVGSAPLTIPFSPHEAGLQPEDPAQKFAYSELHVVLWIAAAKVWSANTGGTVTLYGADDHPDTMLRLNPGESARIIGKGKFFVPTDGANVELLDSVPAIDRVYAQVSLYRSETLLTPTATATVSREICLAETQGQSLPIALSTPRE